MVDQNKIYIDGWFDVCHLWLETSEISICVCDDKVSVMSFNVMFWNT